MKKTSAIIMVCLIFLAISMTMASSMEVQPLKWADPRQLTTGPTQDFHASVMQDSSGTIWLVWARSMPGETGDIWYMTSSDGGLSWSASNGEILVPDTLQEGGTSILQDSSGRIWVVWASGQYSPSINWDIFCTYSDDGGQSWAARKQLTDSPNTDNYPKLIEVSGEIRVYYMQQPASNKIWYLNTTIGGETWNGPYQISTPSSERVIAPHPLLDSTGKLWLVWTQDKDVYFKTSSDNGASWSPDQPLTTGPNVETTPCIVEDVSGKIFVFYTIAEIPGTRADVWYQTTSDCGDTWSEAQELTANVPTENNGLACASLINNEVWVVWSDTSGDIDLWMSKLQKLTDEWAEPQRLTTDSAYDFYPSIMQDSSGKIWLVWASAPSPELVDVDTDLLYKTSMDGGVSWSDTEVLVPDILGVAGTSLLQDSTGRIWVAWGARAQGFDIFYIYSDDHGFSWSLPDRITSDPGDDSNPSLIEVASHVWVVYRSGSYIKIARSDNDDWSKTSLTSGSSPDALVDSTGKIWVSFNRAPSGPTSHNIYYRTSTDNGESWSPDYEVTTSPAVEQMSSIIEDVSGRIFIFYDAVAEPEAPIIRYKTTENSGDTWSDYQELTADALNDQCPYATLVNNEVWVIWHSFERSESADIWMSKLPIVPKYFDLIQKYFPYWNFSKGEKWLPCSFYFDGDSDVMNNPENYENEVGDWNVPYVYIHVAEDEYDVTIEYWLYYTFNDFRPWGHQRWSLLDHEHDWDSTICIVFDKDNLNEPRVVYFFSHLDSGFNAEPILWEDVPNKNCGKHVIAYVANGSHGAYPSLDQIPLHDVWATGGLEYRPEDFNWIIAEECERENDHELCWVPHVTIGVPQNEPAQGYWPHYYPRTWWRFSWNMLAPWHRPEWKKGMFSTLTLQVNPSIVKRGEIVTFAGQLIPQISTTIYLEYRRQGTSDWITWVRHAIATQSEGCFSKFFRMYLTPGVYEFRAHWPGNMEDPPTVSQLVTITVT